MAITGLTHNEDGVIENKVIKYRGKISAGYGPNEGPNKNNYPVAAGHFIVMKEDTVTMRKGDKTITKTKWVVNDPVQKELEVENGSKEPRGIKTICLVKTPEELWDSFLAKYGNDGLECIGHGIGTDAKFVKYDASGEREWDVKPCTFKECPDYISKACKARGVMKIYPNVDSTPPNPYKLTTSSINTIRSIESSLEDIWNLIRTAHAVKENEAGKPLGFDGLFGLKLMLIHKKIKSGGKDVFVTEIVTSKKFRDDIMSIINREISRKESVAAIEVDGTTEEMSLLESASEVLVSTQLIEVDASVEEAVEALDD